MKFLRIIDPEKIQKRSCLTIHIVTHTSRQKKPIFSVRENKQLSDRLSAFRFLIKNCVIVTHTYQESKSL